MLLNARQILVSELVLVEQKEKDEVEEMVDNKINVSYEMHTKLGLDPEVEIKPESNIMKKFIPQV